MTTISSTTGATSTASTDRTTLSQTYDQFLKLLVTQLKNQDPLNPTDSSQFTNQLVQYSQVEQQIKTNDNLTKLINAQNDNAVQSNLKYIGNYVVAESKQVDYTSGTQSFRYSLDKDAKSATFTITDSSGNVVRSIPAEATSGAHKLSWDGKNTNGVAVPAGIYKISITAPDANGKNVGATTYVDGKITAVTNNGGTSQLMMGNVVIDPAKIIKISTDSNI